MAQSSDDRNAVQYLSFTIAGTDYGLPILTVKEILQYEQLTTVPGTPRSVRGVVNVRGQVVPILDLAVKFGRGETVPAKLTCILVVEVAVGAERLTVGVLADAVNEVLDLPLSEIDDTPSFGANVRVDYVTGVGKVGKRFVLLLDADRVVSGSESELVAQADAAARAIADAPAASAAA